MSRKRDMARAKAKIAATDWFTYISATLVCSIQRSIIPIAAVHVEGGGDWMDACSAIAAWAKPHVERIKAAGFDFGQSEGILPFATWHVLLIEGQVYVADTEFYPYPR
jgi:hypothetical protein